MRIERGGDRANGSYEWKSSGCTRFSVSCIVDDDSKRLSGENRVLLEAHCSMVGEPWVNVADGVAMILKYTVEGVVETREHVEVGTVHMDVVTIIGARAPGTFSVRFVIHFSSGKTVEGTMTGTQIITNVGVDVEGRFVGHGDMHIMGSVNDIDGQPGTLILDGYSW